MKDKILILTNSNDGPHSESVINHLIAHGQKVFRFDVDKISGGNLHLNYFIKDGVDEFVFCNDNDQSIVSDEIKSVWYRRPNLFDFKIQDVQQKAFAEKELETILEGLWISLDNVFWVSHPRSLEKARKKIVQLHLARNIGFLVPETIITNNPEKARGFISRHKRVITKTLNQCCLEYEGQHYNALTTVIERRHLDNIELVEQLPILLQVYIEKEYELRITAVGEKIFSVRIDSQIFAQTEIDWRHPSWIAKLPHTIVNVPTDVATACRQMLREFDLQFGTFDIVVQPDGQYVFLELNPNGQWYWIEHLTGLPISTALSELLTNGVT